MDESKRIDELETKLAWQEAALADLGALVIEYRTRVERLEGAMKLLSGRLADLAEAGKEQGMPASERPPHY
ncbi:MAG TPA: SlyX family protein [Spirochaetales bacterium]|nr:SlyX family protein [Spirochaetales bacterium]